MASNQREITGVFLGEQRVFVNENDAGSTRVIIGEVEVPHDSTMSQQEALYDFDSITIKGEADEGQLRPGLTYRFYGRMKTHHKYGEQFNFEQFVIQAPAGQKAIKTYLQQCRWVGPAKADAMWRLYGEDAVRMLREQPEDVAHDVPRFPAEKAREAAEELKSWGNSERAKIDLLGLLHGCGLPKKLIGKLLDEFGCGAVEIVRADPYLLMEYPGVGFSKADKLYLEFGHDPTAMRRQSLCAWNAIRESGNGDTWLPRKVATDAIYEKVAGVNPQPELALEMAIENGLLTERVDQFGVKWLAEWKCAAAEERVARYIALAAEETQEAFGGATLWPDVSGLAVDDHQRQELAKALKGVVSILGGRPGTGKTYSSAEVIKALIQMVGADMVAVCAPTGKAAVRLTEALTNAGVEITAKTIHSLLKVGSVDGDGWEFEYGEDKPLPFSFVVIDEASMLSIPLMDSLLSARGKGTHYLFVGDTNQLAPVEHGAPLRDAIAAGVPFGELTEIHRNKGAIVQACKDIVEKKRFGCSAKLSPETGDNLLSIPRETPEEQIEQLTRLICQFRNSPARKYDAIWDVQVLCAVNKKSPLGRKPLNTALQDLLNPKTAENSCQGNPFRVGDKIINLKNGKFPTVGNDTGDDETGDADQSGKVAVANGEQAEVLQVEPNRTVARLSTPDRIIIIPRGNQEPDDGAAGKDDAADDATSTGCSWDLGYAISCHKSQGSEWPVVIVMIDEHNGAQRICTRNWLYTAISRAKIFCLLLGKKELADQMCFRDGTGKRKTFLVELLREKLPKPEYKQVIPAPSFTWTDEIFDEVFAGVL